jgi:hypothetical protein
LKNQAAPVTNSELQQDYTLFVVVTNRDVFLKKCVESFKRFYPSIRVTVIDNSGTGQFEGLARGLYLEVQVNDRLKSVTENQNWILDHCRTKYFVFAADDILFLAPGFLEEAVALHGKGFELVSLGVDDPCAFSMITSAKPRIGRFNEALLGKEKTDMDIKERCEKVYGFLPSVGGFWRYTSVGWESKYIHHPHDKPDVNQFLIKRGLTEEQVLNERKAQMYQRVFEMLHARMAVTIGGLLFKSGNYAFRGGLIPAVFQMRHRLRPMEWRHKRVLSVGQIPRHAFWPQFLAGRLGAPKNIEKIIIEKCEAYKPFLEQKFKSSRNYRVIADDVLNIDKYVKPESVDLTVWYDGPEHLEKDLALEAIKKLERITTGLLLIGTPKGFHPQGSDSSFKKILNAYNTHLSGWEVSEWEGLGYRTYISRHKTPNIVAWKHLDGAGAK